MREPAKKRNITPQKAVAILRKEGYEINEKEAEIILNFLYFLAKLTVNQYIKETASANNSKDENSRSLRKGEHR